MFKLTLDISIPYFRIRLYKMNGDAFTWLLKDKGNQNMIFDKALG